MKWLHYLFIVSLLLFSCKGQNVKNKRPTRLLTDALQREVALPDTIRQLVCIRSSAIRLVTYAGGAPLICGVEEQETRPNEFTHIFAHPDLARLPIIGPGMGGDPELIMAALPERRMLCRNRREFPYLPLNTVIWVETVRHFTIHFN